MITEKLKQQLIKIVAENYKKHGGYLAYTDIIKVLKGNSGMSSFDEAAFCIEASVIAHQIPLWENGQPKERIPSTCFTGAITFTNSYKDESELIEKSSTGFGVNTIYTNFKMPKLAYSENTHDFLHPGSGTTIPDFIGSDGKTYEAKYDYQKGSPSSLHNADYLINCINPGIAIYPVPKYGDVNVHQCPLARYTSVLSPRLNQTKLTCGKDLLNLINSGELIYDIEKLL